MLFILSSYILIGENILKKYIMAVAFATALIMSLGIGILFPFLVSKEPQSIEKVNESSTSRINGQQPNTPLVVENLAVISESAIVVLLSDAEFDELVTQDKNLIVLKPTESSAAGSETINNVDENKHSDLSLLSDKEDPNLSAVNTSNAIVKGQSDVNEEVVEQVVKDEWINEKISENRDQISDGDLSIGAQIYDSLDTSYLFGLANDGLTDEEKSEAMTYLQSNLSPSEFEIAKNLYMKYVNLLN